MEGLTEGRIVHYVLNEGPYKGQHRPAIVVHVWRSLSEDGRHVPPVNGCCQLQVFADSGEDKKYNDQLSPVMWKTSVLNDEQGKQPGTWHWIEKA